MGLFDDTIRDARRPLGGACLRRSATADAAPPQEKDFQPDDMPDTGMQTVFRIQKAESPVEKPGRFREASYRPGAGKNRIPAGDPLPAWAEVREPEPRNKSVEGNDGITALGVKQKGEPETGQVIHGSPGKIAAADVKSVAKPSRSEVSPGPFEPESYRETLKSEIPEGSERLVSPEEVTFLSRPPGRGASPSEFFPGLAAPSRDGGPATGPGAPAASAAAGRPGDSDAAVRQAVAALARASPAFSSPAAPYSAGGRGGDSGMRGEPSPSLPVTPSPARQAAESRPQRPPARSAQPAGPGLVIGRIDVVVVAAPSPPPAAPARPDGGYASRNYLKRL